MSRKDYSLVAHLSGDRASWLRSEQGLKAAVPEQIK